MSSHADTFPRRVSEYFSALTGGADDPIGRQFEPTDAETRILDYELADPLGEDCMSPFPRLVHRYADRALVLVTDRCAIHCRYCFRRHFSGSHAGTISPAELAEITDYLQNHAEVAEVLLSGGDPLTLTDDELKEVLSSLRGVRDDLVLRLCTRVPGVLPDRISDRFCRLVSSYHPVWVVFQINHPNELTRECTDALDRLISSGIPVVSQTVLLRGVNDNPDTLARLFHRLTARRVKPYYLFQADLVRGTSHFRVPLRRSLAIVSTLRQRISNLALPVFALDIPGGGGKIQLHDSSVSGPLDGWFELTGPDGEKGRYPDES